MNATLSRHGLVNKLTNFTNKFNSEYKQDTSHNVTNTLQQEIYKIEKTLADTRPSRIIRRVKPLGPVTEQQRIIDLAG